MQENLNIEKIIFKVVQIKFLAMHITNTKLSFYLFTVQNIFMENDLNILMIFGIKYKFDNFYPYNVLLAIATNILQIYLCWCSRDTFGVIINSEYSMKYQMMAELYSTVLL